MANDDKTDRRTRKFAEVVPPQPTHLETLSNRGAPPPPDLGPLEQLVGVWIGRGTGWNMIALPFQDAPAPPAGFKFRVLMNQYDEELRFTFVDDDVPNRGLTRPGNPDSDQFVVTLDYQQKIAQVAAEDRPDSSGLAGAAGLPIHHEPGLWLYEKNRRSKDDQIKGDEVSEVELDVARLASIPHGNSVLALGTSAVHNGMPDDPAHQRAAVGSLRGRPYSGLRLQGCHEPRPVSRAVQALHRQPVHGKRRRCAEVSWIQSG